MRSEGAVGRDRVGEDNIPGIGTASAGAPGSWKQGKFQEQHGVHLGNATRGVWREDNDNIVVTAYMDWVPTKGLLYMISLERGEREREGDWLICSFGEQGRWSHTHVDFSAANFES